MDSQTIAELMRMARVIYPALPFIMLGILFLTAWVLVQVTGW